MKCLSFIIGIAFLFVSSGYAVSAKQIIDKLDELGDYTTAFTKVAMVIYPDSKNAKNYRIIKMLGYSKGKDDAFYKYVYPNSVKGMKMLSRGDDIWMYFPSTGRKRKVASYNKKQSIEGIGGDFSYQDMSMGAYAKDYKSKILKDEGGQWHLELIPLLNDHAYKRIELVVNKGNYRILKIKYYDGGGFLKALFFKDYKKIKSYDIPQTMTMVNYRSQSKTVLKTISILVDIAIDSKFFDANRLENN